MPPRRSRWATGTGINTEICDNYTNGTSQLEELANLPNGASDGLKEYAGLSGLGTNTEDTTNFAAGGSDQVQFDPGNDNWDNAANGAAIGCMAATTRSR